MSDADRVLTVGRLLTFWLSWRALVLLAVVGAGWGAGSWFGALQDSALLPSYVGVVLVLPAEDAGAPLRRAVEANAEIYGQLAGVPEVPSAADHFRATGVGVTENGLYVVLRAEAGSRDAVQQRLAVAIDRFNLVRSAEQEKFAPWLAMGQKAGLYLPDQAPTIFGEVEISEEWPRGTGRVTFGIAVASMAFFMMLIGSVAWLERRMSHD